MSRNRGMPRKGGVAPNIEPVRCFSFIVRSYMLIGTPMSSGAERAALTTVPALRIEASASATISPRSRPTVTIVASAPRPCVNSAASAVASAMSDAQWVAPIFLADSVLNGCGSQAITLVAPACTAPWIAKDPTPPAPMTIAVSPGSSLARFTAEPQPV
jgi:hypothetical protein